METPADTPLEDIYAEACRVVAAATDAGLRLRLLGGVAVRHHCPSTQHDRLARAYKDIDLVGPAAQRTPIQRQLVALGYQAQREFNLLNGARGD